MLLLLLMLKIDKFRVRTILVLNEAIVAALLYDLTILYYTYHI